MKFPFKSRKRFYILVPALATSVLVMGLAYQAESQPDIQAPEVTPSPLSMPTPTPNPSPTLTPTPTAAPEADSPSPGTLVFASTRDGDDRHFEIYTMNADGSNQTRLTTNDVTDYEPCLSRDGRKIVFSASSKPGIEGNLGLYIMNIDGTNRRQVADFSSSGFQHAMEPNWSPDGKRITFVSSYSEIYVVDADGSHLHKVVPVTQSAGGSEPEWNADGTKIVFQCARAGQNNIWSINANGSGLQRLTQGTQESFSDSQPTCSPDGRRIAFIRSQGEGNGQVWMMNADGSEQTRLSTDDIGDAFHPTWSPDSRNVAFACARGRHWSLYSLSLATLQAKELTRSGRDNSPSWGPKITPSNK